MNTTDTRGAPTPRSMHRRSPKRTALSLWVFAALLLGIVWVGPAAQAANGSTTMAEVTDRIGAIPLAEEGITGAGIDVAVIDTGVEPVRGLDGFDKVVVGPDLSFEAGIPELYGHDTYGHGTVMASIIAGNDGPGGFQGVAPGSRILSVKVADNTGAVDVSQVIAALDWVIEHGRADGMNVRVINLSYVTDSDQPYLIDPLAHAVERAWRAGYVVVVAAGNAGGETTILGNPAADPYVIAVGAYDGVGAAVFSNRGSKTRVPDVLAPGDRILGLAAPTSRLALSHPEAIIDGRYLRGSGTSQATAVVSGSAALLLEQRPDLTPDQVKALLIMGTVDSNGRGRASELDPTKRISEFFDLLDIESNLRADAATYRLLAIERRTEAQQLMQEAASLSGEAAAQDDEAARLKAEAKRRSGSEASVLKRQAKELAQDASRLKDAAKDLEAAAKKVSTEADDEDKKADGADRDADKARHEADSVRVPDYVREQELAKQLRREAGDLSTEADLIREKAATLLGDARSAFAETDSLSADAKRLDADRTKLAASDMKVLAQDMQSSAEALLKQAEAADKKASRARDEADKADRRAAGALAKLEADIAKIFEEWDGVRLGGIRFDAHSGAGLIDLERSAALPAFGAVQRHPQASGGGSLEASRGTSHVQLPDGSLLEGEVSFTGSTWTGSTWTGSTWTGLTWSGLTWSGSTWTGSTWTGSTWTGLTWSGSTWTGSAWSGLTWSGSTWSGAVWS